MFVNKVLARKVDTLLEDELTTLKTKFEMAKKTGSPKYLENLLELLLKEKQKFNAERAEIENSIANESFALMREDLLLRALHSLKHDGVRKGANTIEFMGGKFTRSAPNQEYAYKGKDQNILEKVKKKYSKIQQDQDEKKLQALEKYFTESEKAIRTAIRVRDADTPPKKQPIRGGAGKLGIAKIKAFNQLPGLTCPGKGDCFNWCFALSGMTSMPDQMNSYAENLGAAERDDFVERVNKQIKAMKATPTTLNGKTYKKVVRIHAYGDFHTPKYVNKWREITKENPDVFFYAYTKSFYMKPMQSWLEDIHDGKQTNVKIIQSHGSKFDDKINPKYPIAQVYDNEDAIKGHKGKGKEKLAHCSDNDIVAADPKNHRIAIVKHGNTPCAAGFCPYKKTTADNCGECQKEIPIIHMVDQIDLHHHIPETMLSSIDHLGPHLTPSEHYADFGRHMQRKKKVLSFRAKIQSQYRISHPN